MNQFEHDVQQRCIEKLGQIPPSVLYGALGGAGLGALRSDDANFGTIGRHALLGAGAGYAYSDPGIRKMVGGFMGKTVPKAIGRFGRTAYKSMFPASSGLGFLAKKILPLVGAGAAGYYGKPYIQEGIGALGKMKGVTEALNKLTGLKGSVTDYLTSILSKFKK